jgi:hypothetical protein
MDSPESPRATVAVHAPTRAFAAGTETALGRLGYHLVRAESAEHEEDASRFSIRIVDDRQLEEVPVEGNGHALPIILLTGPRGPIASDARTVGTVLRRAGLKEVFALLQETLEATPRSVPRIPTSLPARCIHGNHGWAGAIRSISEKGCLFHSTERLEPDRRIDLHFALPSEGLLQIPAQPSYVDGKVAGLVFRNPSDQTRSAIEGYVTAQLTEE